MTDTSDAPLLKDFLANSPKNWGRWGEDDEVGALNFLSPQDVVAAAAEIRTGKVFTLQRLIGDPDGDPAWPGRDAAEVTMVIDESTWDDDSGPFFAGGGHYADDKISAFLQGSTQYDALGHVWYDGMLWNGYDARTTIGGLRRASVQAIAERGVVGRAVLLDVARFRGETSIPAATPFGLDELLACAAEQGTSIQPRDILIIRTNHLQLFYEQGPAFYDNFCEPGLQYSPELVEWFHDMEIPNLVTDLIANEITKDQNNGIIMVLHQALMRNLGVTFTELCDLEALAQDSAEDGRYSFVYAAAPLKIRKASGSPVNPIAIK